MEEVLQLRHELEQIAMAREIMFLTLVILVVGVFLLYGITNNNDR